MKFNKKNLISALALSAISGLSLNPLTTLAANALPGDTFVFKFEGGGASAAGSFSMAPGYNTTESLSGVFNVAAPGNVANFTAINMSITGASAGNGTFSLANFSGAYFESTGALNFSTNLAGQANLADLNFFGTGSPAPLGTIYFTLTSDYGNGTDMILTCFYLQGVGTCGNAVTLSDLSSSLASSAAGVDFAMSNANLLINGAHSRPLARRVAVGEKTAWIAGDWGRDDHGSRDGSTGVAEIGGGYNFGPAQVNLTLGKTWGNQHLANNGSLDADGQYVMAEGIIPVSESRGLFATVGAYGHWGEVDIRRGYLNSGVQDFSTANPDTHTYGVRARLDWENALAVKSVEFSPYADLSYTRSRMQGYTEKDGGLPVRFDSRTDHSTEIRGGVNASMPLAATKLNLVANLEAAHRFNDRGASTSGEVIGLFSFNLPGQNYQSDWLKGGVGVEGALAKGKATLMLNATTRSSMPNAWLAASYQLNF